MRIAIGSDHAGFEMKQALSADLVHLGFDVLDIGAHAYDAQDDYPDFALLLGEAVAKGEAEKGVLLCGSGVGASIAANKIVGVRAAVCTDTYSGHQGVEHDDMNVLVMGSRITGIEVAREIMQRFVTAEFSNEDRHIRRLNKVREIEARWLSPK